MFNLMIDWYIFQADWFSKSKIWSTWFNSSSIPVKKKKVLTPSADQLIHCTFQKKGDSQSY